MDSKAIDNELCPPDSLVGMGEDKANTHTRRLIVRLRVPSMDKMVVEVELGREYLSRCWKLMLICGKIKRTMGGGLGQVIALESEHTDGLES